MIISRTPFRVSFFGGGTDYPVWYKDNAGAVLSTSINKYCYITCRYLPPFFDHKTRVVWSKIESVKNHSDIEHPAVREALKWFNVKEGVEIHHDGDLPARSGLGSSSSFAVGIIHALSALQGKITSKDELAKKAIILEQELLNENVGSQDQVAAAFGGFNKIEFFNDRDIVVSPVTINPLRKGALQDHIMLFFTGLARNASDIAAEQIRKTPNKKNELLRMREMVEEAMAILNSNDSIERFGKLLDEAWNIKRGLTTQISTTQIDHIYEAAKNAGASGGKLLGAGAGGFMLFIVRPDLQIRVREALKNLLYVPMEFENSGSQIIYYGQSNHLSQ